MAGEYMNNFGSYPQYGMGPQVNAPTTQQNPFNNLANIYNQQLQQRLMTQFPYGGAPQVQQQMQQMPVQQAPPMASGFTIRSASNIEEVRATPIDLMSVNVFVNLANNEIYVSQLDDKGLKDIKVFKPATNDNAETQSLETSSQVVTDFSGIYERLDGLESKMDSLINNQKPINQKKPVTAEEVTKT